MIIVALGCCPKPVAVVGWIHRCCALCGIASLFSRYVLFVPQKGAGSHLHGSDGWSDTSTGSTVLTRFPAPCPGRVVPSFWDASAVGPASCVGGP